MRGLALLALIVVLVAGCGADESSRATVPMLVGLKESVATQAARQAGLRPDVTYGRPDDRNVPEGVVYSQSIREGSIAEDGDTVTLWVSTRSS